ncbi:MAG: hypothetical protein A2513_08205 [Sulfurimonas sp. RIFOXYD12_FULL_33_39]|uniref:hypothetical protein n=1 Tax=unclassified Sulfurimonas TaxID=2623549 RepID=UPI0008D2D8B6|nr:MULTISPECIES: hypothetical protein [unclassified Sulfurimonas]OHE10070.1 MAG: hypothetical protein A2513_08205 [Sulfurimonas sp. RIFOXYD12_FULL_33_39]OHE14709.1 MAG: hypothetical protein A2530_02275 [Sulfurimonas sp. RIFOXYD2_FULL_34_21]
MEPVAGAGISVGTVVLIGVVIAGVAYLIYKGSKVSSSTQPIKKLIDDDDKYKGYKIMIENAIKEKDWQTLEDFLDSRAKKYPDLIKIIEKALKERK